MKSVRFRLWVDWATVRIANSEQIDNVVQRTFPLSGQPDRKKHIVCHRVNGTRV